MKKTINLYELKKLQTEFPAVKITCSNDSAEFIRQFYGDDLAIFESCFILLLNRQNNTIGYAKISQGGIAGTVVDVKLIAKYAVEALASGLVLCHNHPSGALSPSTQDRGITEKVKKALGFLDVTLLDHIILTEKSYLSFADESLL